MVTSQGNTNQPKMTRKLGEVSEGKLSVALEGLYQAKIITMGRSYLLIRIDGRREEYIWNARHFKRCIFKNIYP